MNRYKKLKIGHSIRVIVRPQRTAVIRFRGVLGMMTVDMRVNGRGGERSPLEHY